MTKQEFLDLQAKANKYKDKLKEKGIKDIEVTMKKPQMVYIIRMHVERFEEQEQQADKDWMWQK